MTPPAEIARDMETMAAMLSMDHAHRYWLRREWRDLITNDQRHGRRLFVMLNPSTADAEEDDPTIRKCRGFAQRDGAGSMGVVNLFSIRETEPLRLMRSLSYQRPGNATDSDSALEAGFIWAAKSGSAAVICAWGKPPWADATDRSVGLKRAMLKEQAGRIMRVVGLAETHGLPLFALDHTADGWPRHPSRLPYAEAALRRPLSRAHVDAMRALAFTDR